MDQKIKILVSGDVNGNFKQIFNRVESINKKSGPFEILLCVGEFFGENNNELIAYKNGNKIVPIPTYILGPTKEGTSKYYKSTEEEICPNLTYLGKRGLYTLSSGLKIAYLSGSEASTASAWTFTKEDVIAVKNSCFASKTSLSDYKGIDVLITSPWPQGISDKKENMSKLISYLAKEIKPRYHFCGLNKMYFEPPPYRNAADNSTQLSLATRFISLAEVGNQEKHKYVYALNIAPVDKMRVIDLIQKTTNELDSPFNGIDFKDFQLKQEASAGAQYFYDLQHEAETTGFRGKRRQGLGSDFKEKKQRPTFDQEKCWFCLSSANVEKHLVISIGENFYLALAKGPINNTHILILSVTHIQNVSLLSNEDWQELERIKNSLRNFFKSQGQVVCFFERNYKTSHLQINAIAVDEGYSWKIKHGFEDKAEEYNLTFESLPKLSSPSQLPQQGAYFIAELPDNSALLTRQMKQFPLHFAREIFCSENLLNCEEKIDWKECKLSKDEETSLVQEFRKKYHPFDFMAS